MKKISWVLISALFLAAAAQAQEPVPGVTLSFRDTLRIADERNADILVSRDRIDEALSRLTQARSYFFPDISGEVSENRRTENLETFGFPLPPSSPALAGPYNVFDARVRITQTLFDVAMIRRFHAAAAGGDLSKAESRKVREDVLALAGTLFVQARRAESRVDYARENLRLAAKRDRIVRQRLGLGTASETEVKSAAASLSSARYLWRSARSDASAALLDLKNTLGYSPRQEIQLLDDSIGADMPVAENIPAIAEKHPDIAVLDARRRESKHEEAAERAAFLPSVQGTADYGATGRSADHTENTYFYGVKASWDFFDFGRRSSRVREAAARSREAKTNLDQGLREKESKIYEARDALKNARRYLRAGQDSWLYEKTVYETVKNRFENGSASGLDLIAAQTSLARSADELEESKLLYRIAGINLNHALGRMKNFQEETTDEKN